MVFFDYLMLLIVELGQNEFKSFPPSHHFAKP